MTVAARQAGCYLEHMSGTSNSGRGSGAVPPPGTLVPRQGVSGGPAPYVVRGELGSGGMGVVVHATDQDLNRPVALKVMWDASDAAAARRFAFEAEVTAQLDHPGIVPVHDRGVDAQGRPYYTMRLVRGRSLAEIIDRLARGDRTTMEAFSLPRLVRALAEAASAVAYAHDLGVIHRDLKPHNIMVGSYGEVQVMDWGLARMMDKPGPEEAPGEGSGTGMVAAEGASQITVHGSVRGTPAYMPPEQARGETWRLDRRADVYALGAILYEILTLTPPYRAKDPQAILEKVAEGELEPPEERAPRREVPRALSAIVMQAMSWHPADRYASAIELRRDLEAWLDGRAVSAHSESAVEAAIRLFRRFRLIGLGLMAGIAIAIGAVAIAFVSNISARREAETAARQARAAVEAAATESAEKRSMQLLAAPALVAQARAQAANRDAGEALKSADMAIAFDGSLHEARLVRAGLLMAGNRTTEARAEITAVLAALPTYDLARQMADICDRGGAAGNPKAFYEVLGRLGLAGIGNQVAMNAEQRARLTRDRIIAAWPQANVAIGKDNLVSVKLGKRSLGKAGLTPLTGGPVAELELNEIDDLTDLSPLRGMPLVRLTISQCTRLTDLSPLAGMPLNRLTLRRCAMVRTLAPLTGMPLTKLDLAGTSVSGLSALTGMPLKDLDLAIEDDRGPAIGDLSLIGRLPLERLRIAGQPVADLGQILQPALRRLDISRTKTTDLLPLMDSGVTELRLGSSKVRSLAPLAGSAIEVLYMTNVELDDPGQLRDLPSLRTLVLTPAKGPQMDVVRSLHGVQRIGTSAYQEVDDQPSAAEFWRRFDAGESVGK